MSRLTVHVITVLWVDGVNDPLSAGASQVLLLEHSGAVCLVREVAQAVRLAQLAHQATSALREKLSLATLNTRI